jgi:hypothetical protein
VGGGGWGQRIIRGGKREGGRGGVGGEFKFKPRPTKTMPSLATSVSSMIDQWKPYNFIQSSRLGEGKACGYSCRE